MRTRHLLWFTLPALPARLLRFSKLLLDIASQLFAGMNCRFCTSFWMRHFLLHFLVLPFCADSRGPPPCSSFVSVFADAIIQLKTHGHFENRKFCFMKCSQSLFFFPPWYSSGHQSGICWVSRKNIKMSERALRHAISSRSGVPKLKGHQPPALGTHYFRNAPAQVHYYPTKTYTQLAEMNHELVLQVFCAHYGRHLPLSQACHAMLPGLSLYLLKSESELDHTTNLLNHTN